MNSSPLHNIIHHQDELLIIFSFLSQSELLVVKLVCKFLNEFTDHDLLWNNFYVKYLDKIIKFYEKQFNSEQSKYSLSKQCGVKAEKLISRDLLRPVTCNFKKHLNELFRPISKLEKIIRKHRQHEIQNCVPYIPNPLPFFTIQQGHDQEFQKNVTNQPFNFLPKQDNGHKILFLGDSYVGKTCLGRVFCNEEFPKTPTMYEPTTIEKDLPFLNGKIKLTSWDSPGAFEYSRLLPLSYPYTEVFMLCVACNSIDSLFNVHSKWIPEILYHCGIDVTDRKTSTTTIFNHHETLPKIVLLMTKIDLRKRALHLVLEQEKFLWSHEEGMMMAKRMGCCSYLETSAVEHIGVEDITEVVFRVLYNDQLVTTRHDVKETTHSRCCLLL
ncbi:hypothetical protein C9374_002809 [Naegleria lovaniensis]|uniref:F-box domain-containing protein n=1 Tax=Naegleria lovaniensis TaxID=51637 RepID=A0AA88KL41_NAELO|nr:uncharacterized protein C9374_002809 [Naegleria lovaniensis]KAG2386363.1 hypothetical protein C9374_002809 [Naegleria lovaniensis]